MAMAETARNPQQLHIKISRYLPLDLKRALHPSAMDELCKQAFANGWTDPEWLAGYALEGTSHSSVENPAAVFVHRMREICATQCPTEHTPQPANINEVRAQMNSNHQPASDATQWADSIRKQLHERTA